jgi:hypothetical protein
MDAVYVIQLVYLLGQKRNLNGPELMLYISLCELLEIYTKYSIRSVREVMEKQDDNTGGGSPPSPECPPSGEGS